MKRTWHGTVSTVESAGETVSSSVLGLFQSNSKPKSAVLEVKLLVEPNPVDLKKCRAIEVTLQVHNTHKRTQVLEFASGQRADAVLRDAAGKVVARASEDAQFSSEPTATTINPGERLEYKLTLPTRALSAGQTYTLEAVVVSQSNMLAKLPVVVK